MIYIQFSFNFHNAKKERKKESATLHLYPLILVHTTLKPWCLGAIFCSLEQQQHCFSAWDTWVSGERQVSVRVQGYQTG